MTSPSQDPPTEPYAELRRRVEEAVRYEEIVVEDVPTHTLAHLFADYDRLTLKVATQSAQITDMIAYAEAANQQATEQSHDGAND